MKAVSTPARRSWSLTLGAVGVVYGDLGTSPLYAFQEAFNPLHALAVTPANIYGVLSLIIWSLILIATLKYATFALRADNGGEGGIFPLMALVLSRWSGASRWYGGIVALGLIGAAMFYGDSTITPAISVLSAVHGLQVINPGLAPWLVPLTVAILVSLFAVQAHGTTRVGHFFGPVMLLWFMVLSGLGAWHIMQHPLILNALNPWWGMHLFWTTPQETLFLLGVVILALTGAEAMYADMGHFGRHPVRHAWYRIVFPALVLNYLGQGALVLTDATAAANPFFRLVPTAGVIPLVILSTLATIIASQAVISGAFSMTAAAIKLGYLPRLKIQITDDQHRGQVYIPFINWLLLLTVIALVITFQQPTNLAAAYGLAVNVTMGVTTIYLLLLARQQWRWSLGRAVVVFGSLLAIEASFLVANTLKIPAGGWYPLLFGMMVYGLLVTWHQGRDRLQDQLRQVTQHLSLESLLAAHPLQVPGTGVFFSPLPTLIPFAFIQNLHHNHVIHQRVFFVHLNTADLPHVSESDQLHVASLAENMYQVTINYGFRDTIDIPAAMARCWRALDIAAEVETVSYFVGRRTIVPTPAAGLWHWQKVLFAWLYRNAESPMTYFRLPPQQVVEMGMQVEV
ncbi:potassium transporter Kup [Parathermosynechococcus lividus PCC 6715]|uniref:Probable potassium transport system protein Kup n=1 Tax=Parathermosynechococcus lividus PCC 6715 TaxID=1917166 RepID=A0A2D2Q0N5_PARLV|nr:potassium transporter Kup [Thermostichus lividus]ATS17847.1 potassium transporter Kup [Thermostichus lividus PCC 6715]